MKLTKEPSNYGGIVDQFARGFELLDAVVAGVGDPDVAFDVEGDAFGFLELAGFFAFFAEYRSERKEGHQHSASAFSSRSR